MTGGTQREERTAPATVAYTHARAQAEQHKHHHHHHQPLRTAQRRRRQVGLRVAPQQRQHLGRVGQHDVGADQRERQPGQAHAAAEVDRALAAHLGAAEVALADVLLAID